jgi:uncharacterized protein (TIGR03437 family)
MEALQSIHMSKIYLAGIICLLLSAVSLAQPSTYNIATAAGNGTVGYSGDGAAATSAELDAPESVALDGSGNIYIADTANQVIRKVSGGNISTVAGNGTAGYTGDGAAATSANLYSPSGVAVDSAGNLYISDYLNNAVRKVSGGNISTVAGGAAEVGTAGFSGDGGSATSALLSGPVGLAVDSAGNLYIADSGNNRIRMVTPGGTISTVAGNGTFGVLHQPFGIALDAAGNLYVADSANNRIRKVAANGAITTVAGNGTAGFTGDGGPALSAEFNRPYGVAIDSSGDLYIADCDNSRIRQVSAASGTINTIAGRGGSGYYGDGGPATSADLNFPTAVAVNSANGNVYIADHTNNVIRLLTPVPPAINSGGVDSAYAFGGFSAVAPGSWMEIYGTNLSVAQQTWTLADFSGVNAPTLLAGTAVTIGGQPAFVDYVSGGQVNAQVPSNVGTGQQGIVVKTAAGTSASYNITVNATEPGLLAPPSFKVGGTQYVVAQFAGTTTYVGPPGAIPGLTTQRANPGDTIVLYGVGFGPTPPVTAGQIAPASENTRLTASVGVSFGSAPATVSFAGLSPGTVGLYQFNVVVPNVTGSDAIPLTFTLAGTPGTQTLYIAVQ